MAVAAEERQAAAPLQGRGLCHRLHHPRTGRRGDLAEALDFNEASLHRAVAEGQVHLAHGLELLLPGAGHRLERPLPVWPLQACGQGLTQLAQVVEIGIAEQQPRLRSQLANAVDVVANGRVAGEVDQREVPPALPQQLLHRQHEWSVQRLDAAALQFIAVAPNQARLTGRKVTFQPSSCSSVISVRAA